MSHDQIVVVTVYGAFVYGAFGMVIANRYKESCVETTGFALLLAFLFWPVVALFMKW